MDYANLIKKIILPGGFKAPQELTYEDIVAKPLTRKDLQADVAGINTSLDIIRQTRGGSWPAEAVTEDFNFLDLAWHEQEFREANSFTYVIYDIEDRYLGCLYLYPLGTRTTLTEALLKYDVDASWWVTTEGYKQGYYEKVYKGLQIWLTDSFPFKAVYYSNKEMP